VVLFFIEHLFYEQMYYSIMTRPESKANRTRNRILKFIGVFMHDRGYAPTVRDIARGCNVSSPSVVQYHLNILERQRQIRKDPGLVRSIRLTSPESQGILDKVIGAISKL
jgi:SOS-response transcriptional repressor LexA